MAFYRAPAHSLHDACPWDGLAPQAADADDARNNRLICQTPQQREFDVESLDDDRASDAPLASVQPASRSESIKNHLLLLPAPLIASDLSCYVTH